MKNKMKFTALFSAAVLLFSIAQTPCSAAQKSTEAAQKEESAMSKDASEASDEGDSKEKDQNDTQESADSDKLPDFTVMDQSEEMTNLYEHFGKPLVINFWATWCGPCTTELPEFQEAYEKYGEEIEFMMVNLTDGQNDTLESVKEFVEENGYEFPVYFDVNYDATMKYGISSIPLSLFMDEEGYLKDYQVGMITKEDLTEKIENLLS